MTRNLPPALAPGLLAARVDSTRATHFELIRAGKHPTRASKGEHPMKLQLFVAIGVSSFALSAWASGSTTLLKTSTSWDGARIDYSESRCPEVDAVIVTIGPNESLPVHLHPVNNYVYMLSGSVTVSAGDMVDGRLVVKSVHEFKEGDAFAEVVNTWHIGVAGPKGARILVWYTTKAGYTYTIKYAERPNYNIDRDRPDDSRCPVGEKASRAPEAPQTKSRQTPPSHTTR